MRQIAPLFFLLFLLTSCYQDFEALEITTSESAPNITLGDGTATARGRVIDNEGRPVAGVRVSSNFNESVLTDEAGLYEIIDFRIGADGDNYFYIFKQGYFQEFRKFSPNNKSVHLLDIVINARQPQGQIDAAAGGTYTSAEGVSVQIPAGAARSGNTPYTGIIDVTLYFDDPRSMSAIAQSAANLPAWGFSSEVELATFGMVQLEFTGDNGQNIWFLGNNPAILEVPVPDALQQSAAQDTVRFWQLEEIAWSIMSTPQLRGGTIRANINGGGLYNCDVPYPRAKICGRLVSPDGLPLVNQAFTISIQDGAFMFTFRTDNRGQFCASVARDQRLSILIPDPCNPDEVMQEFVIGPYPEGPTDIGDLELDFALTSAQLAVTNCTDGSAFTDDEGILWISGFGAGLPFLLNGGGLAQIPLPNCDSTTLFAVQAVAHDGRRTSELGVISTDDPGLTSLTVCGELEADEYFTASIDGGPALVMTNGSYLLRQTQELGFRHQLWGENISGADTTEFFISLPALAAGTYNPPEAVSVGFGYQSGFSFSLSCGVPCQTSEVIITETGPDNSWVAGTFSYLAQQMNLANGTIMATDLPITGTFRLNR